jgi:phenylpropionate dioxygenase-like ring-hydroxylating dioxygenase large terminal subunit
MPPKMMRAQQNSFNPSMGRARRLMAQRPHREDPLSSVEVSGCLITCLSHGWRFDVNGQKVRQTEGDIDPSDTTFFP